MCKNFRTSLIIVILTCTAILGGMTTAFGEKVTLRLKSGGFSIKGELLSFDGSAYIIQSNVLGVMSLDASKFSCIGAACSNIGAAAPATRTGPPADPIKFSVHGSNTIGSKLMPALIRGYAESVNATVKQLNGKNDREVIIELKTQTGKTLAKIDLQRYGSSTAFPALANRKALIGMADRSINTDEENLLAKIGYPNMRAAGHQHVIGLDGILIILSPQNPIKSLSTEQLAKIFAGQIQDWSEIGGAPHPIKIYAPDNKSGTFSTFRSLVLKPRKLKISSQAQRYASNAKISDLVAKDPGGIGITGFAYKRNAKPLAIKDSCGLIHRPTIFHVKTEAYPLSRRLYLYTTDYPRNKHAKGLLQYVLSQNAQPILSKLEFIDQTIDSLPFEAEGGRIASAMTAPPENFNIARMKDLITDLRSAERLSSTFRFETGSSELDSKSKQEIRRVVRLLKSRKIRAEQVILAGFADSLGAFDQNRGLSLVRAESVKDALVQASQGEFDPSHFIVKGYGELLPVSCNDTELGRQKNRRVEIWVLENVLSAPGTRAIPSARSLHNSGTDKKKQINRFPSRL